MGFIGGGAAGAGTGRRGVLRGGAGRSATIPGDRGGRWVTGGSAPVGRHLRRASTAGGTPDGGAGDAGRRGGAPADERDLQQPRRSRHVSRPARSLRPAGTAGDPVLAVR